MEIGYASYPRLAGGPLGLFLLGGDAAGGLFVRRFDGGTFAAPVAITTSGDSSEMHLHQDPAGRLHAVYSRLDAAGYHAEYATSDDGVTWATTTLATAPFTQPGQPRVAAAAGPRGGRGVAERHPDRGLGPVPLAVQPPPPPPPPPPPDPVPEFGRPSSSRRPARSACG